MIFASMFDGKPKIKIKHIYPTGRWCMSPEPASGPGRDEDPARHARGPGDSPPDGTGDEQPLRPSGPGQARPAGPWRRLAAGPDWMGDAGGAAGLAARESEDEPDGPDLDEGPDNAPP